MASTLRPIRHEDRLSLVEHLDELRKRLIICIVVFLVAFGVCLWQDNAILDIMNRPLDERRVAAAQEDAPKKDPLERTAAFQAAGAQDGAARRRRRSTRSPRAPTSAGARAQLRRSSRRRQRALAKSVPPEAKRTAGDARASASRSPRRSAIVAYAALLLSLPFLLFQAYAFVLPAFSRRGAAGRAAADADGAVPVHRRRRVRVLHGAAERDQLPAELQRRQLRHPHAGQRTTTSSRSRS